MLTRIDEAVSFLRSRTKVSPALGMILGSGLGDVVDAIDVDVSIPYGELPHAPVSSVAGHSGELIVGHVGEVPVAVMKGRVHYYEGYSMDDVIFLPRVLGRLGIGHAIVTNAAGGVNESFTAGDLMLITDHINMMGANPLRGRNVDELGVRFPDMSEPYPVTLRDLARRVAEREDVPLREGVYLAVSGPSYETPAEIRAFRALGADAVGMSTIPEVIAFFHMSIPTLGISCITNMAAGILPVKLTHAEVIETTTRVRSSFTRLVLGVVRELGIRK